MLFSCVLRRLFCFNSTSLYKHTRMRFENSLEENVEAEKGKSPGIVARLMGLESVPVPATTSDSGTTPLNENCPPSLVFSLEHEKEFIVFRFEDGTKGNNSVLFRSKPGRKRRKRIDGKAKRRQLERHSKTTVEEVERDGENLDPNKVDHMSCPNIIPKGKIQRSGEELCLTENSKFVNCEKYMNRGKQIKVLDWVKAGDQHCDFENSSPVSVLDDVQFYTDPRVVAKSEEGSVILGSSNSRRKLSTELGNCDESPPSNPVIDLEKLNIKSNAESRQKNCSADNFTQMLDKICKMAQEDVIDSNGAYIKLSKLREIKDISAEFEVQIIGTLLDELIDQLIELPND